VSESSQDCKIGKIKINPEDEMNLLSKILNVIMIILTLLLTVTAIPGGVVLMANIYAPPVEQLQGSFEVSPSLAWRLP
jgi:hypothetical protein